MKIVNDPGIDRITRDLSGAMWILARLPENGSASGFIHRCFRREVWDEIRLRDRLAMRVVLPAVPLVILVLTAIFTTLNGFAIKKRTGKGIFQQIREQIQLATQFAILSPWYYISSCMTMTRDAMLAST